MDISLGLNGAWFKIPHVEHLPYHISTVKLHEYRFPTMKSIVHAQTLIRIRVF